MECGATLNSAQHSFNAFIVLDQQISGRRAHEDFHTATSEHLLHLWQHICVVMCRAGIERMIGIHPALRAGQLVSQRIGRDRGRVCVRHLEHGHDAAQRGRASFCFEVGLVLQSRFPEVNLAVDHTGQNVQAGCVIDFSGINAGQVADMGNTLALHADVGLRHAAGRNDGAAFQDQIIGHGKWGVTPRGLSQVWFSRALNGTSDLRSHLAILTTGR